MSNAMNRDLLEMYKKKDETRPKENEKNEKTVIIVKKRRRDGEKEKAEFLPTKHLFQSERPTTSLQDLAGVEKLVKEIEELVIFPLKYPEAYEFLGSRIPKGILLHGPPGCGKTALALACAGSLGETTSFFRLAAPQIVSSMSGDSEERLRNLFKEAKEQAPSLLLLDEIDAITPKRESASKDQERRIVSQLLLCLDEIVDLNVLVIACTSRPEAMDPALRRAGRFDREIEIGLPSVESRKKMLEQMISKMPLGEIDLDEVSRRTAGYLPADLQSLVSLAATSAMRRVNSEIRKAAEENREFKFSELAKSTDLQVTEDDFFCACDEVQPSLRRDGFSAVPSITFDDVGGLDSLRMELEFEICEPIRNSELYRSCGLDVSAGILLFGPPGCGKTLVAKAAANAARANFISVKGPELLNKYVGESERAVRQLFSRARTSAPCVIFFDELDALTPSRQGENQASERVVNQMLTEMDGMQERRDVYVLAATNRPDMIDTAMLRPGRLGKHVYVGLPDAEARKEILEKKLRKVPHEEFDLSKLAAKLEGYTGADLAEVVREATLLSLKEEILKRRQGFEPKDVSLTKTQIFEIIKKIRPSVDAKTKRSYEEMARNRGK